MIHYYIHPRERDMYRVSRLRHYHNDADKPYLTHAAWLDDWGDEWNLHYDGCDYQRKTIVECIAYLIHLDGYTLTDKAEYVKDECVITVTDQPYVEPSYGQPWKAYIDFFKTLQK